MPRTSAAALSVVPSIHGTVDVIRRPYAPSYLSEDQAREWKAIVNRLPADWFPRETHGLLATYCFHVAEIRHINALIQGMKNNPARFIVEDYDRLLKLQERESRALASLATRMRISQQSQYEDRKIRKSLDGVTEGEESPY